MSDEQLQAGSQDMERVRDIIFGSQMREYQQRFDALQRDLVRFQQEMDQLNEQLAEQDRNQGKKVQTLRRDLRQADDDLRTELRETAQRLTTDKVERRDLGRLFLEIGTRLNEGTSVDELLQHLVEGDRETDRDD